MLSTLYTAAPNGNGYGRRASSFSERAEEMILNAMSLRLQGLQRYLGAGGADRRRDVYDEAGYPQSGTVTPQLYQDLYEREPLAAKVVELLPVASWQVQPTVYETEDGDANTPFERAWDALGGDLAPVGRPRSSRRPTPAGPGKTNTPGDLASQVGWYQQEEGSPVWEALLRADVQSRIGRYGILVLGVDDGLPLSAPARGVEEVGSLPAGKDTEPPDDGVVGRTPYGFSVNAAETRGRRLRYLKSFPERYCPVSTYEMNFRSPRFGMPVTYLVTFNVGESRYGGGGADLGGTTGVSVTKAVHWTRVVHVCDVTCNYGSSDVYGGEAMRTVLNNILGVQKIVCAGPEMFWKAAFLTTWLVAQQGWEGNVLDEAVQGKIKDLVERMDNGLQRTATVQGLDPKTTAPGVTDPNPHVDAQVKQVSLRLNIPKRILEGSERGELSSSQDEREWKNQVRARQRNYTTPRLIVPFVDRLILLGVLPEPSGYSVDWPDVSTATDAEKAQVLLQRTQAYAAYVAQGVENVVPPAYYLTRFDDFTDDEAKVILADAEKHQEEVQQKAMDDAQAKIDAGLAPDPQAPPAPPEPVKLKPGETMVPHPNSPPGKKFPPVKGAPLPKSKPVPPTRNATTNATTNANPKGCNQYTGPNCSGRRGKDGRLLKDGGKKPKAEGKGKAKGASRTPAARKATSRATVEVSAFDPGVKDRLPGVLAAVFGRGATPAHVADVLGASAGDRVKISQARTLPSGNQYVGASLKTRGGVSADRGIEYDPRTGRRWVTNDTVSAPEGGRGRGAGTRLFKAQVAGLTRHGFDEVRASGDKAGGKNGYYTLPRWGFDGPLPAAVRKKLPPALGAAKTVQDVMATGAGREWWKARGVALELTFDLSAGSRGRKVLSTYQPPPPKSVPTPKAPAKAKSTPKPTRQSGGPDPHDVYERAGSTAKRSEINAALRRVVAMKPAEVKALAARMGVAGKDPNALRRAIVDRTLDRRYAATRSGLVGRRGSSGSARLAHLEDEPALTAADLFSPKPKGTPPPGGRKT